MKKFPNERQMSYSVTRDNTKNERKDIPSTGYAKWVLDQSRKDYSRHGLVVLFQ